MAKTTNRSRLARFNPVTRARHMRRGQVMGAAAAACAAVAAGTIAVLWRRSRPALTHVP